jgi:uncharacterized delta-60 repeat protein
MKLKVLILLAGLLISTSALAAPGELDPTFNGTGIMPAGTTGAGIYNPVNLLLVQPDGKILLARGGANFSFDIVRLDPSGTPDLSFGDNGVSHNDPAVTWWTDLRQIVLQPDGKILMAGSTAPDSCSVARLNADGSTDMSFGVNGLVATYIHGEYCWGTSVAVDPDGKVILGGYIVSGQPVISEMLFDWMAMRFKSDGSPDTSFGTNGVVRVCPYQRPGNGNSTQKVLVQPDGKIILIGSMVNITGAFGYVRLNSNGTLDSNFGNGGIAALPSGFQISNGALQPDGKIIALGTDPHSFVVMRTNSNGTIDTSFGTGGRTVSSLATAYSHTTTGIVLQPDGKILAGGATQIGGISTLAVIRYNADGTVDRAPSLAPFGKRESVLTSFWGNNGMATLPLGIDMRMCNVAIDPAGRVVIFGQPLNSSSGGSLTLARFQGDSSPYASVSGTVRTSGGLPIRNAYVTLSGGSLSTPVTVLTNNLGIYQFIGLPVTETYTVAATAKRFRFAAGERAVMLNSDTENFDFTANP